MARPSRTGGKISEAKARNASPGKGRKTTKTKPRIAPAATRTKRRSVSDQSEDLKETCEQQAATAEILKVIASSPSDVQPVFDAIVRSAAKLFEPCSATITTLKDDKLYWGATAASISGFDVERVRSVYPIPFDPDRAPSARAMLERRIVEIPDVATPETPEFTRKAAAAGGFRSITFAPLVDREQGIGTIIFTHPQAGFRYSERQLATAAPTARVSRLAPAAGPDSAARSSDRSGMLCNFGSRFGVAAEAIVFEGERCRWRDRAVELTGMEQAVDGALLPHAAAQSV